MQQIPDQGLWAEWVNGWMNEWVSPRNVLVSLSWITGSIGKKNQSKKPWFVAFTSFHGIKTITMTDLKLHMRCRGGAPWVALAVENWLANAGDKRCGFDPWSGRSPGRGYGNPLQYSCLENSKDRVAWWAMVHVVTKRCNWNDVACIREMSLRVALGHGIASSELREPVLTATITLHDILALYQGGTYWIKRQSVPYLNCSHYYQTLT